MSATSFETNAGHLFDDFLGQRRIGRQAMFQGLSTALTVASLIVADLFGFACAILAGIAIVGLTLSPSGQSIELTTGRFMEICVCFLPIAAVVLLYSMMSGQHRRRLAPWRETNQVVMVCVLALVGFELGNATSANSAVNKIVFVALALTPISLVATRRLARSTLAMSRVCHDRVLIVGSTEAASAIRQTLGDRGASGFRIAGSVVPAELLNMAAPGQLRGSLARQDISRLVLVAGEDCPLVGGVIRTVVRERIPFTLTHYYKDLPVGRCDYGAFDDDGSVIFCYEHDAVRPWRRLAKAAFDVVAATILLAVFSIVMVGIAFLIRLDGGPALFAQERIGAGGKTFRCFKFRSMVMESDRVLRDLLASDPAARREWDATQKLANDPRVTRIGRFLRATSLDELPQFINVLRLEMSLVGPRPIVSEEIRRYADNIAFYYDTKPGITGLWQVSGRSDTTYDRRVQLDASYVKNWSMRHDFAILLRTLPTVLLRRGAR